MSFIPKFFIFTSFFILLYNGSSLGFILSFERLGSLYGTALFSLTSLVGVLFASIAEDGQHISRFYCKYCMLANAIIFFYPVYFTIFSKTIIPDLIEAIV
ncbi:hypothetical protein PY093_06150 [Cytobacillus sp. S13-E01]|uniref:hypothetical protein n=1 Tax=Cytobacillus sp. S13-E01 TaxID=3031326 RepID=UPI0023D85EBC|nr:hypothetical protein [Cytobacillus sp. S13-E01]MDF0726296.1 hypothetical protein [Cytobacillus sp. S13-E01]